MRHTRKADPLKSRSFPVRSVLPAGILHLDPAMYCRSRGGSHGAERLALTFGQRCADHNRSHGMVGIRRRAGSLDNAFPTVRDSVKARLTFG